MNRRDVFAAIPAIAGVSFFAGIAHRGIAQSTGSAVSLSTVIADYKNSSVAVQSGVTSSLQSAVSHTANGNTPAVYAQVFASNYSTWISSLAEVHYFSDLDSLLKSDPALFVTTPLDPSVLTASLALARSVGLPASTETVFMQALESVQSNVTPSQLQQFFSAGSQALFAQLGTQLTGHMPGPRPVPADASPATAHSGDCNAFFALGLIAGLTGNEIAAAICAYELWTNC